MQFDRRVSGMPTGSNGPKLDAKVRGGTVLDPVIVSDVQAMRGLLKCARGHTGLKKCTKYLFAERLRSKLNLLYIEEADILFALHIVCEIRKQYRHNCECSVQHRTEMSYVFDRTLLRLNPTIL